MSHSKEFSHIWESNKDMWNQKAPVHLKSNFYDNDAFLKGKTSLNDIELPLLSNVKGKDVLHVQCHFGQDSISLARMGANVTATDFSDVALDIARKQNEACNCHVNFIETNTYDIKQNVPGDFDIIFMSYGVKCWLPDLQKLVDILYAKLRKGGRVVIAEFHPMLYTFDWDDASVSYGYNNVKMYDEDVSGTYADGGEELELKQYFWQHSLEEIMMPYVNNGMKMIHFKEHYYSPYDIFGEHKVSKNGKHVFGNFPYPIPHVYTLMFEKEK